MKANIFFFFLFVSFCSILYAQTSQPDLVTDRPDVTESALSVPVNSFQIETGFSFQKQKLTEHGFATEITSISLFNTLFRYGIFSNLEFRFGAAVNSNNVRVGTIDRKVKGISDLMLGTKYVIRSDEIFLTNAALLVEIALPFGAEDFRPEKFEPKLIFAAEQEFFKGYSISGNIGTEHSSSLNKYLLDYSISLGIDVTERLGLFAEVFGQTGKSVLADNFFDCGITYLQTADLQIDFSVGAALSKTKAEWFSGVGISMRFTNY